MSYLQWSAVPLHVPDPAQPCWVIGFAQIRSFFGGLGRGEGQTRQQTCIEKHLTAADCLYISGYLHRVSAPGPCWGTSIPQTPCAHPDFRAWLHHCFWEEIAAFTLAVVIVNQRWNRVRILTRDPTRPDGFWPGDPTRPDPVSSLNDVKSRNVVTLQGQTARK